MILAVDTETTGTDFWHGCRAFMLTACDGESNYIWEGQVNPYNRAEVTWSSQSLKEIQELLDSASILVFHNAKFDMRAIEFMGIRINHLWPKVHDTLLAHHCLSSGDKHALKYLAFKYLDWYNDEEKELARAVQAARASSDSKDYDKARARHPTTPGMTKGSWWKLDYWMALDEVREYAHTDVEMTWALWNIFEPGLKKEGLWKQYETRRKLLLIAYEMEKAGYNIYKEQIDETITKLSLKAENIRKKIEKMCGYKFKWDPSDQELLHHFFFTTLEIEPKYFSPTGRPSLDKNAVEAYKNEYPQHPQLKLYSTYKKTLTEISDIKAYVPWTNPSTGRIHSNVWITGTRETRQSSSDPNLQNISKNLRHLFGPPPGYVWLDLDMVNIEMRIWAYMVGNQELIQIFESTGSVHLHIASLLHPSEFQRLGPKKFKETPYYGLIKNGNFSIIYGATERKADETYQVPGAFQIIAKEFPEVPRFITACIKEAEQNYEWYDQPFVTTLGGYRLDVPLNDIFKAVNYKIQGSAGWIMTEAMIEIDANQDYIDNDCRMIQQVHDSIVIEVPEKNVTDSLIKSITASMEAPGLRYMPTSKATCEVIHNVPF